MAVQAAAVHPLMQQVQAAVTLAATPQLKVLQAAVQAVQTHKAAAVVAVHQQLVALSQVTQVAQAVTDHPHIHHGVAQLPLVKTSLVLIIMQAAAVQVDQVAAAQLVTVVVVLVQQYKAVQMQLPIQAAAAVAFGHQAAAT
jgi:hypothetical protein